MAKHYVTINESGVILRGFSDDFEQPNFGDVCICEDGGRHFEINDVVNPATVDLNGTPLYKLVNGSVIERSESEIFNEVVTVDTIPTLEERTTALESAVLEIIMGGTL